MRARRAWRVTPVTLRHPDHQEYTPNWTNPVIITRYIVFEIVKPLLAICAVLLAILVGYSTSRYLGRAAGGVVPVDLVLRMIWLDASIAMEVVLPIALSMAVIWGLGRLIADREMVVLLGCGRSSTQLLLPVFWITLGVALLGGGVSIFYRPWAYELSYGLENQARLRSALPKPVAGQWITSPDGNTLLFAAKVQPGRQVMEEVLIKTGSGSRIKLFVADEARFYGNERPTERWLELRDAHIYFLDRDGANDSVLDARRLLYRLDSPPPPARRHRSKAVPTKLLIGSNEPRDTAELQWRLTNGWSTFLLGVMGLPLSLVTARHGRAFGLLAAVLVCAVYFNGLGILRNLLEHERIAPFPGLWGGVALLVAVLILLAIRARRYHV